MAGIASIINSAKQALLANQAGAQVASHNIANAETQGFTRQRIVLASSPSFATNYGYAGSGVDVVGIERSRNFLIDQNYRREKSSLEEYSLKRDSFLNVEGVLSEMTSAGLGPALTQFWNSWSDLAASPVSATSRELVRQAATILVDRFHSMDSRLTDNEHSVSEGLTRDIAQINQYARDLGRLNEQIVTSEAGGHTAPDLRDSRDLTLDKLADLVQIRASENPDGSVTVSTQGGTLVSGPTVSQLEVVRNGQTFETHIVGVPAPMRLTGGKVGGALDLLNNGLPVIRAKLDEVAAAVVEQVNALHTTGKDGAGVSGINFFDPAQLTAAGMQLSPDVAATAQAIRSGTSGVDGDGGVALEISRLRNAAVGSLDQNTIDEATVNIAVNVGTLITNADNVVTSQQALVSQIENQRSSISDVSTDEELMTLVRFQHAFSAATRLFSVVDDMYRALVEM